MKIKSSTLCPTDFQKKSSLITLYCRHLQTCYWYHSIRNDQQSLNFKGNQASLILRLIKSQLSYVLDIFALLKQKVLDAHPFTGSYLCYQKDFAWKISSKYGLNHSQSVIVWNNFSMQKRGQDFVTLNFIILGNISQEFRWDILYSFSVYK